MQRRGGQAEPEAAKPEDEASNSAAKFQEKLRQLKAGKRFVFTASKADLRKLEIPESLRKQILRELCRKQDQGIGLMTVEKIMDLEFTADLRDGQGPATSLVLANLPEQWSPLPSDALEIVRSTLSGPPRTDVILYEHMQLLSVMENTAPFAWIFHTNIQEHWKQMVIALNTKQRRKDGKKTEFPQFKREIEGGVGTIGVRPNILQPVEYDRQEGELTKKLPLLHKDLSAICFLSSTPAVLENGLIYLHMKHPITRRPAEFVAMSYAHVIATEALSCWSDWKIEISPLGNASPNNFVIFMEKSLAAELKAWITEDLPPQSFAMPADALAYGLSRHYQTYNRVNWHERDGVVPQDADLDKVFTVKLTAKLTYHLMPAQLKKQPPLLCELANQHLGFDNRESLERKIEEDAKMEVEADEVGFNLKDLAFTSS